MKFFDFALSFTVVLSTAWGQFLDDYENTKIRDAPASFAYQYERKMAYTYSTANDGFGKSVAVYGKRVLVGAYGDSSRAEKGGAAYLHVIDGEEPGWKMITKFTSNSPAQMDYYGWSVSMCNHWILIGAWQDDDAGADSGSVFFYRKTSDYFDGVEERWGLTSKFLGRAAGDTFGISVAITDSGIAVVGAPGGTNTDGFAGAGYVSIFELDASGSWTTTMILEASDGTAADYFGISLAIYNNNVVVGAHNMDVNGNSRVGKVYVYALYLANDYYVETARLMSATPAADDEFGRSVAIWNDVIAVGADGDDSAGLSAGSVYIFQRTVDNKGKEKWYQVQEILPGSSCASCFFGYSLAMNGTGLLVGTHKSSNAYGSAWFFERITGSAQYRKVVVLNASDFMAGDQFGGSVSMHGSIIAVGSSGSNGVSDATGAVYVYTSGAAPPSSAVETAGATEALITVVSGIVIILLGVAVASVVVRYVSRSSLMLLFSKKTVLNI
jgi:hypothetical protein